MIRLKFPQSAQLFRMTGTNSVGDATFAEAEVVDCRWEYKVEMYKDAEGREITSSAFVFFRPDTGIKVGDGVRLSTDNSDPKIIRAVERIPDMRGDVPYEGGVL